MKTKILGQLALWCIAPAFVLFTNTIKAQSLQGTLYDSITQEPLFGATVYILELEKGTSTDTEGKFSISNLPEQTLSIQLSYVGYETEMIKWHPSDGEQTYYLMPTVIEGHDVIVSAPYPSTQDESPVKVEQRSLKELQQAGGTTLAQSLSTIPGVDMVGTGSGIGKPVIRGLSYNRVLVYSDGVRLENQQWGDEHGLGLSSMGVERVEIIKGPSSLLYGSDAMGGVIYLVPEKFASSNSLEGDWSSTFHSNTLGYSSNLGLKYSGTKIRFGVRGGYENHGDYNTGNNDFVANTRFTNYGAKTFFGYNNNWLSTRISYNYFSSNVGLAAHYDEEVDEHEEHEGNKRKPLEPYQDLTTHVASAQNTLFLGESKVKINVGFVQNVRKEFDEHHEEDTTTVEHEEEGPALHMILNTGTYDVKWYLPKKGYGEFMFGVQGLVQQNSNQGEEVLVPDAGLFDIGAASMVKFDFEPYHLQIGLRYDVRTISVDAYTHELDSALENFDAFSRSYGSFNGALGGTWHATEHLLLRLNIASGFRAPNVAELTAEGVHHGTNQYIEGDRNLANEQNVEIDLSAHFHRDHITADISGFYNSINDFIYLNPTDTAIEGFQVYKYVQANAILFGGEAGIDVHPHPLDWLHIRSTFSAVLAELEDGTPLPLIPAIKIDNSLQVELETVWILNEFYFSVGYSNVLAQDRVAPLETETAAYDLLYAGLGFSIPMKNRSIELSVVGNNLLNTTYFNHLSRFKYVGIYNMGQNVTFNLKVPFGS